MADTTYNSSSFSSALLDIVGALIVVLDEESRIVAFNRTCEILSGYSFEEVRGQTIERFLVEDERPLVNAVIQRLLAGEPKNSFANYWVKRSGELRWIEWSNASLRGDDGRIRYILATGIDTTDHIQMEKALHDNEQLLSSLFRSNPTPISIHSESGGEVIDVNPAFEQLVGYSRDDLIGWRLEDKGVTANGLFSPQVKQRLLAGHPSIHDEVVFMRRDGQQKYIDVAAIKIDLSGRKHILASCLDISERKKFEQQILSINQDLEMRVAERTAALEQQMEQVVLLQEKLNQLLRASPVVIFSVQRNAPHRIMFISENVKALFGYDPAALVESQVPWHDLIHPEDLPYMERIYQMANPNEPIDIEVRIRKQDGSDCWVNLVASISNGENENTQEIHASVQDITTRRKYEEEIRSGEEWYRSLSETAHDFIFVISRDDKIQYVNSYGARAFGFTPEEMIGKSRSFFFQNPSNESQEKHVKEIYDTDTVGYFETPIAFPSGEIWLGTRLAPIHDQNGRVTAVLGVSRDITDRIKAEQGLQNALQKEKELNELRSSFVSMISHQVGTPLSTILSSAEMLEQYGEHWPEERRKKHIRRIIDATNQVNAMVRDILELGRAEASVLKKDVEMIDLVSLLDEIVETFQIDDQNRHSFQYLAPSSSLYCWTDAHLVRQVVENLLSNACKYSPENSTIEIQLMQEEQKTRILVRDHGMGIAENDLPQLGTPFFRGKNALRSPGTGLGMALVQRSVQALGGTMTIFSRVNEGTTIRLEFPFYPEDPWSRPAEGER